jgi:hypothetical protein
MNKYIPRPFANIKWTSEMEATKYGAYSSIVKNEKKSHGLALDRSK